jgi:hypothetical protein
MGPQIHKAHTQQPLLEHTNVSVVRTDTCWLKLGFRATPSPTKRLSPLPNERPGPGEQPRTLMHGIEWSQEGRIE